MTQSAVLRDPRARWLGAGALIAIAVAIAAGPLLGSRTILAVDPGAGSTDRVISVGAVGTVRLAPDICDVRLGVSVTRDTAEAARAEAADVMAKVIAALKARGIADADLQTDGLSLGPVYDYSGSTPRLIGYQLSNVVTVTVRDLATVGALVDDAVAAGATTVDSIAFRVDDRAAAEDQARELAMADAKRRAEDLAAQAGVRIVGVASVTEMSSSPISPVYTGRVAADAAASGTPVQLGTNEITVSVAVSYLIG